VKQLKEQIQKKDIGNLYLFYGEERYLIDIYEKRIKRALLQPEDEMMNLDVLQSPQDLMQIEASIETLPFMAEKRLVIVKESGAFDKGGRLIELADRIGQLPETTVLIWIETKIDKRSKLFKAVQKYGRVIEFKRLTERELLLWIEKEARQKKTQIDQRTASYFLSCTGNDMTHIYTELEKLLSYVKEKGVIERQDIDAMITPTIENSIFKLTDYLGSQRPAAAYQIYRQLIEDNEPVQRILYMIIRQFRLLYRASLMQNADAAAVAKELGVPGFAAGNYQIQAKRFGQVRLKELLRHLLEMDVAIKTGEMSAEEAADLIMLQYAKPSVQ
jgi:DNA polymerase-3 subunit delta